MKVSIREGMIPRETLQEKLAWLESVGLDAVELHTGTLLLPAAEIEEAFAASPISVSAIEGIPRLLSADPAEREAAKQTIRERLELAGALGAVGVLVVPQFGRVAALPDLSPLATGAELERNLLLAQLRELAPAAQSRRRLVVSRTAQPLRGLHRQPGGARRGHRRGGRPRDRGHGRLLPHGHRRGRHRGQHPRQPAHLVYVHVADSNRLQPGRGHLDFRPGFRALKEIGYDGPLAIECRVDGPTTRRSGRRSTLIRREWEAA